MKKSSKALPSTAKEAKFFHYDIQALELGRFG